MPYISQEARKELMGPVCCVPHPKTAGELNFCLTEMVHLYWKHNGQNYQAFNDIIGALEGCKLELYRRKVAPYEDQKIKENGDV